MRTMALAMIALVSLLAASDSETAGNDEAGHGDHTQDRRPNIVFVLSDQWRATVSWRISNRQNQVKSCSRARA